jgi:hypothetical protein
LISPPGAAALLPLLHNAELARLSQDLLKIAG